MLEVQAQVWVHEDAGTNQQVGREGMNHKMQLAFSRPNGDSEWYCPECGRRIVFLDGQLYVITPGNKSASHYGSEGGLQTAGSTIKEGAGPSDLSVWEKALEDIDL
jgi:hypothetical protein